ncbi:MAG: hypothetical protein GVY36_16175 [Verrucomicrobia bacterium]|nr:hypothetical protein [Verrucomicrobiota bacterium]
MSKEDKKLIGDRIRTHLQENAVIRAQTKDRDIISTPTELAHSAGVAQSTIFKLHSGEFSMKTLRIVEAILGKNFSGDVTKTTPSASVQSEPIFSGGYTEEQISPYLGTYLTVRQGMANLENLLTTLVHVFWDDTRQMARFHETNKFLSSEGKDYDYSQSGTVHVSGKIGLVHLLTSVEGALRLITLTRLQVMEPVMYGAILTQVPEAGTFVPTKASVHFRKLRDDGSSPERQQTGVITPQHSRYQSLLSDLDEARRATMAR